MGGRILPERGVGCIPKGTKDPPKRLGCITVGLVPSALEKAKPGAQNPIVESLSRRSIGSIPLAAKQENGAGDRAKTVTEIEIPHRMGEAEDIRFG